MRTPRNIIFVLIIVPCGWILELTSTVAPNWRTIHNITGQPPDLALHQGIWDICRSFTASRDVICNHEDIEYFNNQIIEIARRMMAASLIVTLIGLSVATIGTHCWTDEPRCMVASLGGLLIFCSGVLAIIPVAWYHYILPDINSPSTDIRVGYCIILGYTGGITEVLGGLIMISGIYRCYAALNRGDRAETSTEQSSTYSVRKTVIPSVSINKSRRSSFPNSVESLKEEIDFRRAKRPISISYSL
ncbi:claudin-23-like [Electrophorus electricus]|uniref:Claudin 23a n=1 Tax=Electrophorus electricus TaxID=8005 RepID=A0A4W4F309_ELEEL|nr:claudin-23-like [Electrophorus electricus]